MGNDPGTPQQESYTWQGSTVTKIHGARTASNVAGFFTPYLQPGMRLLDCGCGPGSITVGLAQLVAPGETIGIDASASRIETAQAAATTAGVANLRLQTGDVYHLDFEDETFDAVFCNALLEHLSDPVAALAEMRRVLKPGGLIGVRELDTDGTLIQPEEPILHRTIEFWARLTRQNGGNAQIGKQLGVLFHKAGFQQPAMTATTELYGSLAKEPLGANGVVLEQWRFILAESGKHGWVTEGESAEILQAWEAWSKRADSLMLTLRCEAIARK